MVLSPPERKYIQIIGKKGLDEYVKKSDVSDIDRAEQWFNNLPLEVFKYIMLRDLNIDEMLRIYKKEISNL